MKITGVLCFVKKTWGPDTSDPEFVFEDWTELELSRLVEPSEAFIKKYGSDWRVEVEFGAIRGLQEVKLDDRPTVYRQTKLVQSGFAISEEWYRTVPFSDAGKLVRIFFENLPAALQRLCLDPTRVKETSPAMIEYVMSRPDMLLEFVFPPYPNSPTEQSNMLPSPNLAAKAKKPAAIPVEKKANRRRKAAVMPTWKVPKNIAKKVEDDDGMWEDERFDPILLTVSSGVEFEGRAIPLTWHIEFDPYDDRLEAAGEKLEASGCETDGDGWADYIMQKYSERHPKLSGELRSDSESSTCVLWVESEKACKALVETVWSIIHK